jgi:hypothetical protein
MAEYQHIADYDGVLRYADGATIPPDLGNADWNTYLQYVEDGGATDPAPPVPEPPPPPPDPNVRLDTGVTQAVETYNSITIPADAPGERATTDAKQDARLQRLEEALKALCAGHMADTSAPPAFDP